jgi:hypothetical protein
VGRRGKPRRLHRMRQLRRGVPRQLHHGLQTIESGELKIENELREICIAELIFNFQFSIKKQYGRG